MLPGEWRICMNCKGKLRGEQLALNRKNEEYECKVCHEELPEDRFDAEKLKTWRKHCHYDRIVCLQCTPGCAKSWWEKRADSGKYTCSACAQELPRMAYSDEGLCKPDGRICIECNLAQVVQQKELEKTNLTAWALAEGSCCLTSNLQPPCFCGRTHTTGSVRDVNSPNVYSAACLVLTQ